jgi:integrase
MDRWGNLYDDRLSSKAVARVVKKAAEGIGKDPGDFSGHSLRAGLATSAAAVGKSERAIMKQTGHRSVETGRGYIREGELFRGNAAEGLL